MHWWDFNTIFWRFSAIKNTYCHALEGPEHKIFLAVFSYRVNLLTCIGGTLTWNLFVDFQLSRILFDRHWWDLNTKFFRRFSAIKNTCCMHWCDMNKKSFRWFSAIKNTYLHALVGPEHKIFLAIFSYRLNLLTCIGGTLTQSLFGDFQLSRILIDMHLVGPEHEVLSVIFSYQDYLLRCLEVTWT